jgi:hypothetical protein
MAGVQEVVLLALLTHRGTDPTAIECLLTGQAVKLRRQARKLGMMAPPSNGAVLHVVHSPGGSRRSSAAADDRRSARHAHIWKYATHLYCGTDALSDSLSDFSVTFPVRAGGM